MVRVPASFASAPSNPGDAVLPRDDEGDDDIRGDEASKKVVAAVWIRTQWRAEGRLEAVVSAAKSRSIPTAWRRSAHAVWRRKERAEGGGFYRRRDLARGLGFGGSIDHRTARGETVLGPDSSKTMADRWAPPVSILNVVAAYRFGSGR
jgi:hypothetical protein